MGNVVEIRPKLMAKVALVVGIATWNLGWALDRYVISHWLPNCGCYHTEYPYVWVSVWIILLSIVSLVSSPILYIVEEKRKVKEIVGPNDYGMKRYVKLLFFSFLFLLLGTVFLAFRDLSVLYYVNFEIRYFYPFLSIGIALAEEYSRFFL